MAERILIFLCLSRHKNPFSASEGIPSLGAQELKLKCDRPTLKDLDAGTSEVTSSAVRVGIPCSPSACLC